MLTNKQSPFSDRLWASSVKADRLAKHLYREALHPCHWHWICGYRQAIFDLRNGEIHASAREPHDESDALRKSYRMGYNAGLNGLIDFETQMNADLNTEWTRPYSWPYHEDGPCLGPPQ